MSMTKYRGKNAARTKNYQTKCEDYTTYKIIHRDVL